MTGLTWHQKRAAARAASALRSGKPDVQHGLRYCSCCGTTVTGPLDDSYYECEGCEDGCDPAVTDHCFTGHCDGTGCGYYGACELPRGFSPEFSGESPHVPGVTIEVYKLGGGTPGERYHGDWAYRLLRDGEPFRAGRAHTGTRKTHADVLCLISEDLECAI